MKPFHGAIPYGLSPTSVCAQQLPLWRAPNLVTLSGLVCMLAAYLCTAYYAPTVTEVREVFLAGLAH